MKLIINIFSPLKAKVSYDKNFDENYSKKVSLKGPSASASRCFVFRAFCVSRSHLGDEWSLNKKYLFIVENFSIQDDL